MLKNKKSNINSISNSVSDLIKISNAGNLTKQDFIKKYKNITERIDKFKFINDIKQDLNNMYYNLSLLELEILSNNIYYSACLIANNISEKEIINFISYNNISYYNEITDTELSQFNSDIKLKQIKYFINKYSEKIKNA